MSFLKKYPYYIAIFLISLLFWKLQYNKNVKTESMCKNICSDARGYYAWLPYVFIYNDDPHFSFFDKIEVEADPFCGQEVGACLQDYRREVDGIAINKFYPGCAVLMTPFFLIAHTYTYLFSSYEPNGYSPPYFVLAGISGIFYYAMIMVLLLRIFDRFKLNKTQKLVGFLIFATGTNMTYYAIDKPTYSHIYSAFLILLFLYYLLKLKSNYSGKYIGMLSLLVGWIFVTRPVNLSILLVVPFILDKSFVSTVKSIVSSWKSAANLLPVLIVPSLLFLYYKIALGSFFVYSYDGEYFEFGNPKFVTFLFGYGSGFFMYAPVLLVIYIASFFAIKGEYKLPVIGLLTTIAVTIYIHCSWWCLYGSTFGARTMVDFIPCFMLLYTMLITSLKKYDKLVMILLGLTALVGIFLYDCVSCDRYDLESYWHAVTHAFR